MPACMPPISAMLAGQPKRVARPPECFTWERSVMLTRRRVQGIQAGEEALVIQPVRAEDLPGGWGPAPGGRGGRPGGRELLPIHPFCLEEDSRCGALGRQSSCHLHEHTGVPVHAMVPLHVHGVKRGMKRFILGCWECDVWCWHAHAKGMPADGWCCVGCGAQYGNASLAEYERESGVTYQVLIALPHARKSTLKTSRTLRARTCTCTPLSAVITAGRAQWNWMGCMEMILFSFHHTPPMTLREASRLCIIPVTLQPSAFSRRELQPV